MMYTHSCSHWSVLLHPLTASLTSQCLTLGTSILSCGSHHVYSFCVLINMDCLTLHMSCNAYWQGKDLFHAVFSCCLSAPFQHVCVFEEQTLAWPPSFRSCLAPILLPFCSFPACLCRRGAVSCLAPIFSSEPYIDDQQSVVHILGSQGTATPRVQSVKRSHSCLPAGLRLRQRCAACTCSSGG